MSKTIVVIPDNILAHRLKTHGVKYTWFNLYSLTSYLVQGMICSVFTFPFYFWYHKMMYFY